ncbi:MAG: hypothetical protein ACJ735_01435 [Actinomycetes bacterium]
MTTRQPDDRWDPGNPENRERTRWLKAELRTLLMEWDPIGVADAPEAQDEYDGYVGPLLHLLHNGASVDGVAEYLDHVIEGMGLNSRPDVDRNFANTLVAWWAKATSE